MTGTDVTSGLSVLAKSTRLQRHVSLIQTALLKTEVVVTARQKRREEIELTIATKGETDYG